jgi:glycerophosphoryl diester phosphodiesterase
VAQTGGRRPLGFAHRGARAHARENTLQAFSLALQMGATGIETDVWMTADDVPVLHHGGTLHHFGLRRRTIASYRAAELPRWLPRLADLFEHCGTDFDLSLDLKDGRSARAVLAVTHPAGFDPARLWLCGRGLVPLAWRDVDPDVQLVSDTRPAHVEHGWEGHLRQLKDGGGAVVNLRHRRWSAALVDSVHEAGLLAFGWDAQSTGRIRGLLALGCDAVYSDHVDRMVRVLRERS